MSNQHRFPWRFPLLLGIFLLAALPAVFLNTLYGYLAALFLLFLLGLSWGSLQWLARHISVETAEETLQCVRGGSVDLGLTLQNRCSLSCPRASAVLYLSDLLGGPGSLRQVDFSLAGRGTVDFGLGLDMRHIGAYTAGIRQVELWDALGLFRKKVPVRGQFPVLVLPRLRPVEPLQIAEPVPDETVQTTRTTVVGGTDYTGVREYVPGDPMKQIHWKLSAHTRSYLTKIQESSSQQTYTVLLDLTSGETDPELLMELCDCLAETALSLQDQVISQGIPCALQYRDRGGAAARLGQVDPLALVQTMGPMTDQAGPDGAALLAQEARGGSSGVLTVTSRVTEGLLGALLSLRRQGRTAELFLIVPAHWNSRQLEAAAAPLMELEGAQIPCHLVSTAVNEQTWTDGRHGA